MAIDLLVCFAVGIEGAQLAERLGGSARGELGGRRIALLETGVGPVNAAHRTTLFLAREETGLVVNCGIAGAYPGSELAIGDVACAATETFADLGADSPDGFLDMAELGTPVIDVDPPLFNTIPAALFPHADRRPFVTVSTTTGTDARAAELVRRTGGAVESMEGAAVLQVARMLGVPAGEVRGISNPVGDRDRAAWRVREAAAAAQAALLAWIEEGCP